MTSGDYETRSYAKIKCLIGVHNGVLAIGGCKCIIGIINLILVKFWYTNFLINDHVWRPVYSYIWPIFIDFERA